jgi:hypothetical protein
MAGCLIQTKVQRTHQRDGAAEERQELVRRALPHCARPFPQLQNFFRMAESHDGALE